MPTRKIPCAPRLAAPLPLVLALLAAALFLAAPAPAPAAAGDPGGEGSAPDRAEAPPTPRAAPDPLLREAALAQKGRSLVLTIRSARPLALARLWPRPDTRRAGGRWLCLSLRRAGGAGARLLCLGGRGARKRLGLVTVNAANRPLRRDAVPAVVKRPRPRLLVVAFRPDEAGLAPRRYAWRLLWSGGCPPSRSCAERLPRRGERRFRLRPVRAVGCTGGDAGLVTHGPRDRRAVALTFDDGPADLTPEFLRVLREKGAHATFFQVGRPMAGRAETMRRILAEGHELANHTMDHAEYPSRAQIAAASARIAAYTGFTPCLFRPPGGAVNGAVIAAAGSLGMRTVTWDVDPADWTNPGAAAIGSRVLGAVRPGSIVLMHDGGGPRGGTLAALPGIIDALRARGYRLVTVTELLGNRLLYRPYG